MASIVVRTIIIYILVTFSLRIMGKRQIGELDVGDLVSTLLISELAAIPIDDPDIPLFNAIIPILLVICLEIIISTIKNKSEFMKRAFDGDPVYIIYNGRLLQNVLIDNRISVNELLSELRAQGISDISEVRYAIIEPNGTLSVNKKTDGNFAHTVVIDGEVIDGAVTSLGYNGRWLEKQLSNSELNLSDVFLMTVSDSGEINIIPKEKNSNEN